MKNVPYILLFIAACAWCFKNAWRSHCNDFTAPNCEIYEYYNKHARKAKRVVQRTADPSINELSDRFEIFKIIVPCDSIDAYVAQQGN